MKTQNLISIVMIILGSALLLYFGRNGILREVAQSPDLVFVVVAMVVVISTLAVSLTQTARIFIGEHAKTIFVVGLAMTLFSVLFPIILVFGAILLNVDGNRLLPEPYFDIVMWTDFGVGGIGILVGMIPAYVKFFEFTQGTNKR